MIATRGLGRSPARATLVAWGLGVGGSSPIAPSTPLIPLSREARFVQLKLGIKR